MSRPPKNGNELPAGKLGFRLWSIPADIRKDNIFHRIKMPVLDIASIFIITHDATDTGYWTDSGFHETGASGGIKFVGGASNSSWNIGTFTYST